MIEYPKCLYAKDGNTVTVQSAEEEALFATEGWMTAAQYYGYPEPASHSHAEPATEGGVVN